MMYRFYSILKKTRITLFVGFFFCGDFVLFLLHLKKDFYPLLCGLEWNWPIFLPAARPSGPQMETVVLVVVGKTGLGDFLGLPSFLHLPLKIFFGVGSITSS